MNDKTTGVNRLKVSPLLLGWALGAGAHALGGAYKNALADAEYKEKVMAEIVFLTGATTEEIQAAYRAYPGSFDSFRANVLSGKFTGAKLREMGK